ncbi:aldehyde dehydrogenase family 3 comG-like isoform X4 [Schistocerca gregaria]|uniref:aldehyde dehydrogenase family 3 comG-like isoform X4 n=1 Tax=Schistocerca gregaria TaxID=7010 RepID=UPI00211F03DB|nr:aldehyde dehydrogenase family 3 comG-like isoform X4 [Schistocerca gregaria]
MKLQYLDVSRIPDVHANLRRAFLSKKTLPLSWRKTQIQKIKQCLIENWDTYFEAAKHDLKQTQLIARLEFSQCIEECDYMIKNLYSLAEKQKCPIPPVLFPASGFTIFEPYGVVLVISPWNYPLQLSILPLIGAIAAGNCVLLKPSELSPATSTWILDYMSKYVDKECFQVVLGAVEETSALLKLPWNYIFYTGGGRVGRIIAHAAAEHLTPTTLELGGRNPVILDRGIDLDVSIKRLVLAKFVNCGQTCVAPNHVYVHESMIEEVIETVKNVIVEFYTDDPQKSSDYSRIITKYVKASLHQSYWLNQKPTQPIPRAFIFADTYLLKVM